MGRPSTPPYERFVNQYVPIPESGCWIWEGSMFRTGYGKFQWRTKKTVSAHRAAWRLFNGNLSDDVMVLHKCDVRLCVNPNHLFLGDQSVNMQDCLAKGRWRKSDYSRKECKNGHVYTASTSRFWNGVRICRVCDAEKSARYLQRKKT